MLFEVPVQLQTRQSLGSAVPLDRTWVWLSKLGRVTPSILVPAVAGCWLTLSLSGSTQPGQRKSANPVPPKPVTRTSYSGDASCRPCHENESTSYEATAHHLTSRPASAEAIVGTFTAGANLLKTSNPSLQFRMTADENGFWETAVDTLAPGKTIEQTEPIDIVVGSGRKAQTYLYWKADNLSELPVSWWIKTSEWINSPGYVDGAIRFDRAVYPRCLECHANAFASLAPPSNHYEKATVELGIGCERCHGPGRAHVDFYTAHPAAETTPIAAKLIVNPATLPRNRQIDSCSLCHAGLGKPLTPALSFQPGDALERYLKIPAMDPSIPVDVHGNQVQLLERSLCFQKSAMTCSICHNVHQVQRDAAAFSPKCLQCHQARQCPKFKTLGEQIVKNCIDCHMPLKQSTMLTSDTNDQTLQLPVREHRIAIYR